MRVFPVGGPGDGELGFVRRNAVEELASVIVLGEVGEAGGVIGGGEVGAVEGAREVLGDGAAEGSSGIDADGEDVHLVRGGVVGGV